jgi:hypothetical protein
MDDKLPDGAIPSENYDPSLENNDPIKFNEPGNLAYQGAKYLFGDKKESNPDAITPISSPIDMIAGESGARIGGELAPTIERIAGNELGELKLVGSNGALTSEGIKETNKEIPALTEHDIKLNRLKNRFDNQKISKQIDSAQNSSAEPYANYNKKSPISVIPNYSSEPTGIIGKPGISEPFPENPGTNNDQFAWHDQKYGATKKLLNEHSSREIPLTINTSNDLIGAEDYVDALNPDATINMHLLPQEVSTNVSNSNRDLFPGNPSRKRQLDAVERLKQLGINVNAIEPKFEDTLNKIGGPQRLMEKTGLTPEQWKEKAFPLEKFGIIPGGKGYADGGLVDDTNRSPSSEEPIPEGAIPSDQFQSASEDVPEGAIPSSQYSPLLEKYGSTSEQTKAALENIASSSTLGLSTGVERLMGAQPEDIQGREAVHGYLHPGLAEGEKLGGFLGSALIPGGEANIVEGFGKGAAGLMSWFGVGGEGAGILGKAASGLGRLGAETALMQAGDETTKYFSEDPDQTTTSAIANIGLSFVLGAGLGVGLGSISPLWKASKESLLGKSLQSIKDDVENGGMGSFVKKALSNFGGVSEENISKYLDDREAINSTPEFREIYDEYFPKVQEIHDNLADAKITEQDAKRQLNDASRIYKDQLAQKGYELSEANRLAQEASNVAQVQYKEMTTTNAINQAPKIVDSVEKLRDNVISQSENSWNIANKSGAVVDLEPLFNKSEEMKAELMGQGTPEAASMASKIQDYIDGIKQQFGTKNIVADKAKGLIQGLDKISKYDFNASTFDKGLSPYYKQLRWTLDDSLKDAVPEYRQAMKPLAQDTKLLRDLNPFGEEVTAARKIAAMKNEVNYKYQMPLLRSLEERTGGSFTSAIEAHANEAARDKVIENLPHVKEANKTADALKLFKSPEVKQALQRQISELPEYAAHQQAINDLHAAVTEKEGLGGITPQNLETKLKAAMRGKYNVEKAIESLPQFKGKNLSEVLENLKVKQALEGGTTNGSKNVNTFGALGAAAGALRGHLMGGVAGGAAIGSYMDKNGHAVVKKILDFYLDHQGKIPELVGSGNREALSYSLAKMLDNANSVKADAFRGISHLTSAALSGQKNLAKQSKNIFANAPLDLKEPSKEDLKKLDDTCEKLGTDPKKMTKIGGKIGYYMPDHGESLAKTSAMAVNYINSQRPQAKQPNPLDAKIEPTKAQQSSFERTLTIAQNPMMIMKHVKDGTLIPSDLQVLKSIYPSYYNKMTQQFMSDMTDHLSKDGTIPYHVKQSLSLFAGQPLDSTMTPASIQAVQSIYVQKQQQAMAQQAPKKSQKGTAKLSKLADNMMTPNQTGEQRALQT